jgi:hypothetical protein
VHFKLFFDAKVYGRILQGWVSGNHALAFLSSSILAAPKIAGALVM